LILANLDKLAGKISKPLTGGEKFTERGHFGRLEADGTSALRLFS